jgi:hypothetical protein
VQEPNLQAILERFVSGGWETLSQLTQDTKSTVPTGSDLAFERVCQALARIAETPDGKVFLEWLLDLTLRKASWHGQLGQTVEQIASYGLLREGQNSLAALIVGAILKGQGAAPPAVRDSGA